MVSKSLFYFVSCLHWLTVRSNA